METLFERLKRHEGFLAHPKPDNKFKGDAWVIGYGCDISQQEAITLYKNGISQADAEVLLSERLNKIEVELFDAVDWLLEEIDEVRMDVVVEMAFQMGVHGVMGFPRMLAALRAKDYATASKEMLNSAWHKQTPSRCEELASLMLHGGGN